MVLLPIILSISIQANAAFNAGSEPMLMRHPTVNDTTIVFEFADDLWSVPRAGGKASRLTTAVGEESNAFFSPDGSTIAFSGDYDGNVDVYTMPADGGVPKRLTAHPAPDTVVGWSADGKSVLFSSRMLSNTDLPRLMWVPVNGGFPQPLPLPNGIMASSSPDGSKLAYVPGFKWQEAWKRYRGGQTYPIWIARMSDSKVTEIPRENTNDEQPMWVGDKIYYLSDKRGPVGMYCYDTKSGSQQEIVKGEGFDIKSATAGPGVIVYEKLGAIYLMDEKTHESKKVPIEIRGDFAEVRPQYKDVQELLHGTALSPSGSRIVMSARGWILTAPATKGDIRVLDETQGVHRRHPSWSADGRTIAYITDVNNKQQMALWDVSTGKERVLDLGDWPGYYYGPTFSPDSKKIAYTDNKNQLWILDVTSGTNTKVDSTVFKDILHTVTPRWSPDSKWLTWARDLPNHFNAVFVYSLDSGKVTQITDGFADADNPIFDRNGDFLYFYASTAVGGGKSWLDLSSLSSTNQVSSVYAVVLRKDQPNPLAPESDEETPKPDEAKTPPPAAGAAKPGGPEGGKPAKPAMRIDLDDIESRIIALPISGGIYAGLEPGPAGSFFALSTPPKANSLMPDRPATVWKYSFADRKPSPFASDVTRFQTNADGSKALIGRGNALFVVPTVAPTAPGQGAVDLSKLQVKIDPKVEWERMFHEIWRNEKMLFYSPTINGINPDEMERRYSPFLKNINSRNDLNYLFVDMLGELSVGHEFPGGGDLPNPKAVRGGLLGADYSFANHRYRIDRVYNGERWNPGLYAPLAQPGINAKAGEYILEIDGKDLTDSKDIYEALEGKAGRQVKVKLGPSPDGAGAREVTVVPVASEGGLRSKAWAEDNARYVHKMTNGRGGYVHVPDTQYGGWEAFNRYYFAEVGRDGMVVDERFNHGGLIGEYMITEMQKPFDAVFTPRYGKDWPTPGSTIYGPKVMITNQFSGSGGDMFPWLFRQRKVGPIIGKRTWGGLVAALGFELPDGGQINSPDIAFYNPHKNQWEVENYGVPPDIDVELDPYLWRQGHDAQLDAAIAELNKRLANYKAPEMKHPPFPDRSKVGIKY